jgi:hypothetical protein
MPGEGDVLTRVWRNGDNSVEWEFPPVAIVSISDSGFLNLAYSLSQIPMLVEKLFHCFLRTVSTACEGI